MPAPAGKAEAGAGSLTVTLWGARKVYSITMCDESSVGRAVTAGDSTKDGAAILIPPEGVPTLSGVIDDEVWYVGTDAIGPRAG